jgi:hypothetical protein
MSDLVDQSIEIRTTLKAGLDSFREHPERRSGILTSVGRNIASITGRKGLPVQITDTDGVRITPGSIEIGKEQIDRALKWEADGVENGAAAIYGDLVRTMAKRTGDQEFKDAFLTAYNRSGEMTAEDNLRRHIAGAIGSYVSVAPGLDKMIGEFPGLSGAVLASYTVGQDMDPTENLASDGTAKRWAGIWTAMMGEALDPDAVPEGIYPDEDTRDRIREAARQLKSVADPQSGKINQERLAELMSQLAEMMSDAVDLNPGEIPESPALGIEDQEQSVPVETRSGGTGGDFGANINILERVLGEPIRDTPLTETMRQYLVDIRLENMSGQQTGRVGNQLHRIMSDRRVFSKRARVPESPDACVVIAVDFSSSMGATWTRGSRLQQACHLHDALAYALNDLDIMVASCGYCGAAWQSDIHPLNLVGSLPMRSAFELGIRRYRGGNGDVGAMLWSTKQIQESGAKIGAVVFLADGDVTSESAASFRQKAADLNTTVFHVDYINNSYSPFGGEHIHASGKRIEDIAHPLAQGLAKALGLLD